MRIIKINKISLKNMDNQSQPQLQQTSICKYFDEQRDSAHSDSDNDSVITISETDYLKSLLQKKDKRIFELWHENWVYE